MNDTVLEAKNLGKAYPIYRSEWRRIGRWFGFPFKPERMHPVLSQLSFSVKKGEAIGIVGHNGAGKSTLLKMIAGTMTPTQGSITFNGRVSAILELGMGFNLELTGRQNAIYSCGLMGFSRAQTLEVMQEIEAFAEVGDFFDQPVRTYSSGMQMRVAFAVATAFRPDILIIDEAMAVGDAYFQHKCFERLSAFRKAGTTLLLVSHDRNVIQNLCNRALLFHKGQLVADGVPDYVLDYYNALIAEREKETISVNPLDDGRAQVVSGTGEATVEQVVLYDSKGRSVQKVVVGEAVTLCIHVQVHQSIPRLVFGYGIADSFGRLMNGSNTWHTQQILEAPKAGRYVFKLQFRMTLGEGSYALQTALTASDTHLEQNYEWRNLAFFFEVMNIGEPFFLGCSWLDTKVSIEAKEPLPQPA